MSANKIHLDIVLYRSDDDERWVAHCVQLDLVTSGENLNEVWDRATRQCAGQVKFAMKHDHDCKNLFRPATSELLQAMAEAKREGIVELAFNPDDGTEFIFNRLKAA
jgi:RNAse (barnase) inhibitor barstar